MIKTQIKATGVNLTPELNDYVDKRLSAVEKLLGENSESTFMQVELERITKHHQSGDIFGAEVHLHIDGKDFNAETEAGDLHTAIDLVKDEIIDAMRDYKTKKIHLFKRGALKAKNMMKGLADYYKKFRG